MSSFAEIRSVAWKTILEAFNLTDSGTSTVIFQAPTYTVATVPSAVTYARGVIYVSNEAGGATLAFSDGVVWRRVQDRVQIS